MKEPISFQMPTQAQIDALMIEARRQRALYLKSLVTRIFRAKPALPAGAQPAR